MHAGLLSVLIADRCSLLSGGFLLDDKSRLGADLLVQAVKELVQENAVPLAVADQIMTRLAELKAKALNPEVTGLAFLEKLHKSENT